MPPIIPQIVGLLAVATFLFSYQQKKRRHIILLNVTSRTLYILQYLLLGTFSGAALDVMGAISSVLAEKSAPSPKTAACRAACAGHGDRAVGLLIA